MCMLFLLLEYGLGYVFFGITTDRSRERSLTLSSRTILFLTELSRVSRVQIFVQFQKLNFSSFITKLN